MISSIAGSLASSWTANLFAKLDTANNGYIDTASLTEALTQASSGSADSAAEAQNLVGALDENGDAKLTQQELAASLQKLLEEVGSLLGNVGGAQRAGTAPPAGGMPPPPPPAGEADGAGFTRDELQAMVDQASSSDDQRTALMTRIVANFDQADTDSDGKVSFTEARAFDQNGAAGTSAATAATTTSATDDSSAVLANILQLLLAYGGLDDTTDQQSTAFAATA